MVQKLAVSPGDHLRQWIADALSKLKPGDGFPSEQELAERFGVSDRTVRRALQRVRQSGKLAFIPGKGSYLPMPTKTPEQAPPSQEPSFLTLFRILQNSIAKGELREGDPLPWAKFLCYQYKVAPISVQKAFKLLEERGLAARAGKRLWVGHAPRLGAQGRDQEVYFFNVDHERFEQLFENDQTSPAYGKLESELSLHGFKVRWDHLHNLSRLKKHWAKQKRWPQGLVFANAHTPVSLESMFKIARELRKQAGELGPRVVVIGSNPLKPIRGLNWFCTGHINTAVARQLARHIFEHKIKKVVLFFNEKNYPARELLKYSRFWTEYLELDPHIDFQVVIIPASAMANGHEFWKMITQQIPNQHLNNMVSKYRETGDSQVAQNLRLVHDFGQAFRKATEAGMWLFPRLSEAQEALQWCQKHQIRVPEQLSLLCFENIPEALNMGFSTCIPQWDSIGYLLAHAVMGDIPIKKTSRGFIQAQAQFIQRNTTR